ncbi:MAG: radical SAM protein [Bacilli bacterium]
MEIKKNSQLKKSRYNIEVKTLENGSTLMFNTLTSSIGTLDKISMEIYNNIQNLDIDGVEREEHINTIKNLVSNGFLVEKDLDEYKYYENAFSRTKFKTKSLTLTIAVTLDCNMACPYCYETRSNSYMNEETADAIFKFIQNYKKSLDIKHLYINWLGGEPLLNLYIIEYISKKLISYCLSNNIYYESSISTNGVLLNQDIVNKLKECNVGSAQITIDGLKDVHNKRRILRNKQESYDIILGNISECKDIIPIKIRTNLDKENIDGVYNLIDELSRYNVDHQFNMVMNTDNSNKSSKIFFTQEEYSKVDIDLIEYMNKHFRKNIHNVLPKFKAATCNGCREHNFTIDPTGLLHKCNAFLSEPTKAIGNIFTGITSHALNTRWVGLDIPKKCMDCNKLPICGTGCPLSRINNPKSDVDCIYDSFDIEKRLDLFLNNK